MLTHKDFPSEKAFEGYLHCLSRLRLGDEVSIYGDAANRLILTDGYVLSDRFTIIGLYFRPERKDRYIHQQLIGTKNSYSYFNNTTPLIAGNKYKPMYSFIDDIT